MKWKFYVVFISMILISACYSLLIGYKAIDKVDIKKIEKTCNQFKIDATNCIIIDSSFKFKVMNYFADSNDRKNFTQPLQVHYFMNNVLVSNLINCDAPGIFKLNWNTENRQKVFPPKSHFKFNKLLDLENFKMLISNKMTTKQSIVIIVFWSNILLKKSRELIQIVLENAKKTDEPYDLILVNCDALFVD